MNLIYTFQFNSSTLLLLFILPYSYYIYATKYWYLPDRVKFLNFLNICCSVVVAMLCLIRMYEGIKNNRQHELQIIIAHLLLALLSILIVSRAKPAKSFNRNIANSESTSHSDTFKPIALNTQVEKLGWEDVIVNPEVQEELSSVIELLKDPQSAKEYGIAVPKGILLQGPPGTGKTTLAKVIANTAGLSFFALRANEIVSKWVGESEKNLTALFEAAKKHVPAVIFIDEIDSLGKARSDSSASHTDNLLNHLLQLMDGIVKADGIYIIGATNRADLVDEALKRPGRLNRVIEIPLPDLQARQKLFNLYLGKLHLDQDVDLELLAKVTEGNSAADIMGICNQAGLNAYKRESGLNKKQRAHLVSSRDLEEALSHFVIDEEDLDQEADNNAEPQPLNTKIEKITWDDVIVDEPLKEELNSVIALLKDPSAAKRYGIEVPKGILLQGPPGTGKTTLAKVVASTAELAFFALQTDQIISKWVGDSEKNLTRLFKAAAKHAPAVIFIDEIDSIGKARDESNAAHADNLLNHLLQLIDGIVKREGLYIIGATNRAELVDPALKRAGRLNKTIEVPLPNEQSRRLLFELFLAKLNLADYPDVYELARSTPNMSAAEIRGICNQAGLNAFKRESASGSKNYQVTLDDLGLAMNEFVNMKR